MAIAYYGFTQEEWDAKTELERQRIRNWAFEEKFATADEATLEAYRQALLVQSPVETQDEVLGGIVYNKGFRRFFPRTSDALNPAEFQQADETLQNQQQFRGDQAAIGTRRNLESLRPGRSTSFSGCDIVPSITVGPENFVIGNIATISYSIHRDISPVRVLGHTYPKNYVQASRTIAGTLIFTVFDTHVLHQIRSSVVTEIDSARPMSSPLTDQLPPFDVTINYNNEYGVQSYMRIYGLQISDEGQTHSINDMFTENVMQYVARDIDLMVRIDDEWTPALLAMNNAQFRSSPQGAEAAAQAVQRESTRLAGLRAELGEVQMQLTRTRADNEVLKTQAETDSVLANTDIIANNEAFIAELQAREAALLGQIAQQELRMSDPGRVRSLGGSPDFATRDTPYDMARMPRNRII